MRFLGRARPAAHRPLPEELALVLTFHGVVERIEDPVVQVNHLPLATFERLVERIHAEHTVVTLDEVAAGLDGSVTLPSNPLAITFDDGYRSVAELADPVLQRHGTPYAVFVPPGLIDARARVPTYVMRAALELTEKQEVRIAGRRPLRLRTVDDREAAAGRAAKALRALSRQEADAVGSELAGLLSPAQWEDADRHFASEELMDWAEIRALARRGVAIGSHTQDHVVLHASQAAEEIEHQVMRSKAAIEQRLGAPCRHFSYPHGAPTDVCRTAVEAVAAAGYSTGFMNVGGPVRVGMARQLLPRMPVSSASPDEALERRRQLSHSKWFAAVRAELAGDD